MKELSLDVEGICKSLNTILSKVEAIEKRVNPQEEWLDRHEASRFLKISLRTLDSYREKGLITYSKIGGRVYLKKSDLVEAIQNSRL